MTETPDRHQRRSRRLRVRRRPHRAGRAADGDAAVLHRLRDDRHRRARAARRTRRAQAGAPPGPLRDVRRRLPPRPRLLQVLARRRRRDGSVPPARRLRDLRHPGAPRAALGDALPAGRRPGQLRLAGQRLRRRHAIHRVPDGAAGHGDGPRHRRGHRRLPAQLRRPLAGADHPARRGSPTCWSTARPASRSAWPPTSRRTTCARSPTARSGRSSTPTPPARSCWTRSSSGSRAPTSRRAR